MTIGTELANHSFDGTIFKASEIPCGEYGAVKQRSIPNPLKYWRRHLLVYCVLLSVMIPMETSKSRIRSLNVIMRPSAVVICISASLVHFVNLSTNTSSIVLPAPALGRRPIKREQTVTHGSSHKSMNISLAGLRSML